MSTLPAGYKQLEYIESTGTQCIDLGFKPTSNLSVSFEAEIVSHSQNSSYFGVRNQASSFDAKANVLVILQSAGLRSDYYGSNVSSQQYPVGKHAVERIKSETTCGSVSLSNASKPGSSEYNLYVFATNTAGSASLQGSIRIYEKISLSDSSVSMELYPCKNVSGEIGLYDTVGKRFYGNSGTGTFISGPEVITTPDAPGAVSQRTAVALVWGAVECEGYRVYKNGSAIATTARPNYVDYAVGDSQTIEYAITAFNGEYESDSVSVSVTVKEGYTSLIPVINSAFFQ